MLPVVKLADDWILPLLKTSFMDVKNEVSIAEFCVMNAAYLVSKSLAWFITSVGGAIA
jgi:hypothetical protein